ncbi:tetratricopeptide repeat-containing sulfotransferase family protein [Novosphingobium sp.]|uniref:tetratricopeptide repeat-containing sulfotransferase family protein n=1 Tax=Novosphingobium sp. TaxID=1874826 RepID=UPI003BA9A4C7
MSEDLETAARAAAAALGAGRGTAADCTTLGWYRAVSGDQAGALALFERALQMNPREVEAMVGLAGLHRAAGRLRDAALRCDAALAIAPGYAEAWLERAFVMAAGGVMDEAKRCYVEVIALAPTHAGQRAAAHAGLAAIAARDGEAEAGRHHARAALTDDPANTAAITALATIELEAGEAQAARRLVEPALARMPEPSPERMELLHALGDACNRLRDPAAAFAAYARAKQDFAVIHAATFAGRPPHREFIEGVAAGLAAMDLSGRPVGAPPPPNPHIFVLGYPRSGNTLLENVLASLPGTAAIEEMPTLREADLAFLAEPDGLPRFAALDEAALAPYRSAYWQRAGQALGRDPAGTTLVDMDPLKSIRLPLIARLFPAAKVLLVRRDPRDVVWSCFRTSFALSNAAMDFTTLEGAARHYDALMRLTELALARLPLSVLEVPYHRMVQDFDVMTREICQFVGLAWTDDLRRFDRTARARGVSTASARQVRRGLFDGTRQWEPYGEYLAPVMPILQPWIEKLGYAT